MLFCPTLPCLECRATKGCCPTYLAGSKLPRADWNVLQNYKVPVPADEGLLELFQSVFDASLQKIESSVMESKRLIELRDWLLPMLMNGQVTVK